jgi:hypothetical protein
MSLENHASYGQVHSQLFSLLSFKNVSGFSDIPFDLEDYRPKAIRTAGDRYILISEVHTKYELADIGPGPFAEAFRRFVWRLDNEFLAFFEESAEPPFFAPILLVQIFVNRFLEHGDLAIVLFPLLLGCRLSNRRRGHRADRACRGTTDKVSSLHNNLLLFEVRIYCCTSTEAAIINNSRKNNTKV